MLTTRSRMHVLANLSPWPKQREGEMTIPSNRLSHVKNWLVCRVLYRRLKEIHTSLHCCTQFSLRAIEASLCLFLAKWVSILVTVWIDQQRCLLFKPGNYPTSVNGWKCYSNGNWFILEIVCAYVWESVVLVCLQCVSDWRHTLDLEVVCENISSRRAYYDVRFYPVGHCIWHMASY